MMSPSSFESLKREAVRLERQLEDKISRYQQLAQKMNSAAISASSGGSDFLSRAEMGVADQAEVSTLQQEIAGQLKQLSDLVSGSLQSAAATSSQRAVCQRYREILQDLRGDYEKTAQACQRSTERCELLAGARGSTETGQGDSAAMEHLLRERSHINNSMNAADQVIGQADSVRSDLRYQRGSIGRTGSTMAAMANNIPGLNQLIEQIRRRRSRDDKIVAGVIASCVAFTLWYLFG